MGFEKEEIKWLLDRSQKASKVERSLGLNQKFDGRTRAHLLEVLVNPSGRCLQIAKFMTSRKTTFVVIPKGQKNKGWMAMGEAIAVVMFFPSQCVEYRGFKKVVSEEDKLVSVPLRRSFASVVVGEGSRKQGIEPFRRWAKVMVYEFLEACVSKIAIGKA